MTLKTNLSRMTAKAFGAIVALMVPTVFTACDETVWLGYIPIDMSNVSVTAQAGGSSASFVVGANNVTTTTHTYKGQEYYIQGTTSSADGNFSIQIVVSGPAAQGMVSDFVSALWDSGS